MSIEVCQCVDRHPHGRVLAHLMPDLGICVFRCAKCGLICVLSLDFTKFRMGKITMPEEESDA